MRILLFGDTHGIPQLIKHLPSDLIVGVVGASIRPQYFDHLEGLAHSLNVPFYLQPKWQQCEYKNFQKSIQNLNVDLIWSHSYSMIIRSDVLSFSRLGGINLHSALLPNNRGCNPIQWAIINGEFRTGVTLHEINPSIDCGDIIDQQSAPIFFEDTWRSVSERLYLVADNLINRNLEKILSGSWGSKKQDEKNANYCRRRVPEDGLFSWNDSAYSIYNKIRALVPPMPPAFYKDNNGVSHYVEVVMSISEVMRNKYGKSSDLKIEDGNILLKPLSCEYNLDNSWAYSRNLQSKNCADVFFSQSSTLKSNFLNFEIQECKTSQSVGLCQLAKINWEQKRAELFVCINHLQFQKKENYESVINLLCGLATIDLLLESIEINVANLNKISRNFLEDLGFSMRSQNMFSKHIKSMGSDSD